MSSLCWRRGEANGKDVEAVVEVQPEAAGGNLLAEVAVRGGDDPQVHFAPLQRSHGAEFVFLKQAQQLHLHFEREIANLVEEGGAAVGQLHESALALDGAAESALGMAEKFAFHQGSDQRTAIDGHKLARRIGVVNGAGHHFLTRAAFP